MSSKFNRIIKAGFQNFKRNGLLAAAAISVIAVVLFIINIQFAMISANTMMLDEIKNRINISVYFKPEVEEGKILQIKDELSGVGEIASVAYVSKDDALNQFKERNKDNETIQKSLEELGENPLGAALNIKAKNPGDYENIAKTIEEGPYGEMIMKVNYRKYKATIDNLDKEISSNQKFALAFGASLSFVAVLVAFVSIRLTMHAHREEIEIMRLVGASNGYIRMPFIVEGFGYGFIAALISFPLVFAYLMFVSRNEATNTILPISNVAYIRQFIDGYFTQYIWKILALQFGVGIFLGVFSSIIAIRKYLKV